MSRELCLHIYHDSCTILHVPGSCVYHVFSPAGKDISINAAEVHSKPIVKIMIAQQLCEATLGSCRGRSNTSFHPLRRHDSFCTDRDGCCSVARACFLTTSHALLPSSSLYNADYELSAGTGERRKHAIMNSKNTSSVVRDTGLRCSRSHACPFIVVVIGL